MRAAFSVISLLSLIQMSRVFIQLFFQLYWPVGISVNEAASPAHHNRTSNRQLVKDLSIPLQRCFSPRSFFSRNWCTWHCTLDKLRVDCSTTKSSISSVCLEQAIAVRDHAEVICSTGHALTASGILKVTHLRNFQLWVWFQSSHKF